MKHHILVDFENLQWLPPLPPEVTLAIFYGPHQKKFSEDIVQTMYNLGDRGKYKKVTEGGRNSLDTYMAWYLGFTMKAHPDSEFIIVARDKGYDRLIRQIRKEVDVNIKRVEPDLKKSTDKK